MSHLTDRAAALLPELVALRRAIHADPEVGLALPRTQAKVLDALEGLPLEVTLGRDTTSVTAVLRGGRPGPTVLLRGDMDALPLTETTGLDFAATTGTMHACGHDLHTTGLVGAARLLSEIREDLPGSVIFMFQPGEESVGGARIMLAEGVLDAAGDRPIAAYGIHVSAPGQRGVFHTKPGPALSGAVELTITTQGRGGHGSMPHAGCDPVPPLVDIAGQLQVMVTRKIDAQEPVVVSVTQLQASNAVNIIPDAATLRATIRTFSDESTEILRTETKRLAEGIAAGHGCTAEVEFEVNYPVTVNDDGETEFVHSQLLEMFGEERVVRDERPNMPSEDFSLVLQEVPGSFFFLGATPPGVDLATADANHSPGVLFDDTLLADQAAALATVALERLKAEAAR